LGAAGIAIALGALKGRKAKQKSEPEREEQPA